MGLGDGPRWWQEYEWVDLDSAAERAEEEAAAARRAAAARGGRRGGAAPSSSTPAADAALGAADLADALCEQVAEARVWSGAGHRLLLVDLDNLRAGPARWRARMAVVVELARDADHVALAGQVGAVERALPHLEEFAGLAEAVPDGSDLADHALLASAREYAAAVDGASDDDADDDRSPGEGDPVGQVVVASNDGIFADLVDEGWVLTVLSPGKEALSDRLRDAARRTVDLTEAERAATRRWRSRSLRAAAQTTEAGDGSQARRRSSGGGRSRSGRVSGRTTRRRARAR